MQREFGKSYVDRPYSKYSRLKHLIGGESKITKANCDRFMSLVCEAADKPRILVVGGGERGAGTEALWDRQGVEIDSFDIYASNTTDVVCDAHYMPFESGSYDGVWIQAVLEHVVDPGSVAAEIHRVLKPQAVVYAETPFMQQVHEGAYDFTRFTVLGHRYLFRNFEMIDMGGVGGPDVVLSWALRYFTWSLTRSRQLARLVGLSFGLILRFLAPLMSKASMFEAASGVYFQVRKAADHSITHKDLVSLYKGQY